MRLGLVNIRISEFRVLQVCVGSRATGRRCWGEVFGSMEGCFPRYFSVCARLCGRIFGGCGIRIPDFPGFFFQVCVVIGPVGVLGDGGSPGKWVSLF